MKSNHQTAIYHTHERERSLIRKEPIQASQKSLCPGTIFPGDKRFPLGHCPPNQLSQAWWRVLPHGELDPSVPCLAVTYQSFALPKHLNLQHARPRSLPSTQNSSHKPTLPEGGSGLFPSHSSPGTS